MALWQASVARRERDAAVQARLEAVVALDESRAVSDFLMGLFEASVPGEAAGDSVTARELLQRGIIRADQLSELPPVQARMLDVIGQVYERMGEYGQARAPLERALAIRRASSGEASLEVAETLSHLGIVEVRRGDYARAIDLTEEARRRARPERAQRIAGALAEPSGPSGAVFDRVQVITLRQLEGPTVAACGAFRGAEPATTSSSSSLQVSEPWYARRGCGRTPLSAALSRLAHAGADAYQRRLAPTVMVQ
jgi:tetratricopeptide (TPR) repeat protein